MAKQPKPKTVDAELTKEIQFRLKGKRYALRLADFTGEDDLAIYREVGLTCVEIFDGKLSAFSIAALLWRHRVAHGEPKLTYTEVARAVDFGAIATAEFDDDGEGDSDPEASGGS